MLSSEGEFGLYNNAVAIRHTAITEKQKLRHMSDETNRAPKIDSLFLNHTNPYQKFDQTTAVDKQTNKVIAHIYNIKACITITANLSN